MSTHKAAKIHLRASGIWRRPRHIVSLPLVLASATAFGFPSASLVPRVACIAACRPLRGGTGTLDCSAKLQGMEENKSDLLWIFGYGSLIWKPPEGFHHVEETAGFIKGWERRFWQGSTDHRGIPGAPGLVATLLRGDRLRSEEHAASGGEEDSICWGKAYAYGEDERERIIQYLDFREKNGYERTQVDVHRSSGPPIPNAGEY